MFCSWSARQSGEQIAGTAKQATHWLCIEVPTPWKARPLTDGTLPDRLTQRCAEWEEALPGLRIQLIRREVKTPDIEGQTTVFFARPDSQDPALRRLRVRDLDDVAALDVPALFNPTDDDETRPVAGSIVLTCVHGNRDQCCARWGRALHEAIAEKARHAAWQSSHIGGHRFAPTCVVLPEGVNYGWLAAEEAAEMWTAHRDGRLYRLDRYRGFVGAPHHVQAAEIFLREELEAHAISGLRLEDVSEHKSDWRVTFRVTETPAGGNATLDDRYEVKVDRIDGPRVQKSCGDDPKQTSQYRLQGLRSLN